MNKGGIGVGSASIVLVFAVLCLTVFSLIALVVAQNDKALADAEAELIVGYYEADALAEQILAEIIAADSKPDSVRDVDVTYQRDAEKDEEVADYLCQISDAKALYVQLALRGDSCDVLSWRMVDTDDWAADDSLNVWGGEVEFAGMPDAADSN